MGIHIYILHTHTPYTHAHMYIYANAHIHTDTHLPQHIYTDFPTIHSCTHTHKYTHIHICAYTYTYVHTYTYLCTHTGMLARILSILAHKYRRIHIYLGLIFLTVISGFKSTSFEVVLLNLFLSFHSF